MTSQRRRQRESESVKAARWEYMCYERVDIESTEMKWRMLDNLEEEGVKAKNEGRCFELVAGDQKQHVCSWRFLQMKRMRLVRSRQEVSMK